MSNRPRPAAGRATARARAAAMPVAALLAAALATGCAAEPEGAAGAPPASGGAASPAGTAPAPAGTAAPGTAAPGTATPGTGTAGTARPGEPRTLATGLSVPWAIAFLPGGDALVTERDSARLLRVTPQGRVTTVGTVDGVSASGEGGLLGVAVSPKYTRDRYVFVYFTAATENRIVRYRYDGALRDPVTILSGIPRGGIHNGGRLAFGPDGNLYASTGETGDRPLAQALGSLGGKILRMTMDGKPVPGNPFQNVIWSYGHRNVQGMAWDAQGRMYATEFGQNTFDEVNLVEKGHNYGWPQVEGTGGGSKYTDPLVTWSTADASPSGLAYAGGSLWAAALRGERLWQVPLTGGGRTGKPVAWFEGEYGRLRAVSATPDGRSLYVSTSNKDGRGDVRDGDDRILVIPLDRSS
ncbi:hypothetical protein Sru01_44570 [Sphaerisporangium rufum]|uniref:Glucose/Sorbosone dehydrogenase domain-containing protein n=1 Tax=Sphaerisporangium rufum TaxID=1381558 RepID=A0A919R8W4_9ACTN|nr:PQQ-dependent sugar dehydrogenase [Sphaerisporangium rufum]GII79475.1 hypothetical protein Sru01_44570 [Sphaerisporangium rufum]